MMGILTTRRMEMTGRVVSGRSSSSTNDKAGMDVVSLKAITACNSFLPPAKTNRMG